MLDKEKKIGVVISYVSQGIYILTSIIYVPIILRLLGQEEYGLYQLAAAMISNLSLLSIGFDSAYIRYYSKYKITGNIDAIGKLNGMFISVFAVISAVCMVVGTFLTYNARLVLGTKLTEAEITKAKILMFILVITMAVSFMGKVFQAQISAHNRFIWLKMIELIANLINPFISLPLLLLGYGSVSLVCVTFTITVLSTLVNAYFVIKKLNEKFIFGKFDFKLLREMFGFVFYVFINILIEQINWSVDKFLLGRMRGTVSVAVYGVGSQIITIYRTIAGTIRSVFIPQINDMVVNRFDNKKMTELFCKLGRVIYIVTFLMLSGYIVFGTEFIILWAGKEYLNAYYVALFPMIVLLVSLIQSPGIDIQRAMNMHKARSIAYLLIAILNVIVSIKLIGMYGEIGAAIGTAISHVLGQGIFMNIYYHRRIGLNIIEFWKRILAFLPASACILCIGYIIKVVHIPLTWFELFIEVAIYVLCYLIVFMLFGINKQEKELIKNNIKEKR